MNINSNFKIDCVGIGAQKSATSWLHKCLEEHPQVSVSEGKETHYFSKHYDKGQDWFRSKFSQGSDSTSLKVEISTSYLSSAQAFKNIFTDMPNVKILVSLRSPVDRALSHIGHLAAQGKVCPGDSLQEILRHHPDVIENGLYGKHLSKFYKVFPTENIHVIFYEDIQCQPKQVIRGLFAFLCVNETFIPAIVSQRYNTGTERQSNIFRKINSLYIKINKSKLGKSFLNMVRYSGLRTRHITKLIDYEKNTKQYHLEESEIEFLHSQVDKDIRCLERLLNKDLTHWRAT